MVANTLSMTNEKFAIMKVEINKEGVMIITPETWKEDEQLHKWYKENGTDQCRRVIEFKRKAK